MIKKIYSFAVRVLPQSWRERYRQAYYERLAYWTWRFKKIVGLPKIPRLPDGSIRLHLGCGRLDLPDFVNVDARPHRHVHYLGAVESLPFIGDNTVALIYVSHCLEHIPYQLVPRVLSEWFRVLRPGGRLRLAVPDFRVLSQVYEWSGHDLSVIQPYLLGGQDYPQNFHYAVFDERLLTAILEGAGYERVQIWDPHAHDFGEFNDCSKATLLLADQHISVSLNLEAWKPGLPIY